MQFKPTGTSIEIYPAKPSMSSTTTTSLSPKDTTTTHHETNSNLTTLQQNGYVVIRSLLPHHLLLALQATSKYLTGKARSGSWPHVRTVPKQYPPWPPADPVSPPNIWGVQHLLHPDMSVRDVYAEAYFHPVVLGVAKDLVGVPPESDDELVMELFNLLVSPTGSTGFELQWHRDDVKPDVSPDEEARQLAWKSPGGRQLHAQYNIALFPDSSLLVVPDSHRRARTPTERAAGPYATLPDQTIVELAPGDAVFYDSNILHRGVYRGIEAGKEHGRMTLHGSVGLAGRGRERARQVLQHGCGEWVADARFEALEGGKGVVAEGMRRRLVEMGSGEGLGFSLDG